MDFGAFLVRKQWLKRKQFLLLTWEAVKSSDGHANAEDFLEPSLQDTTDLESLAKLRPQPFGDMLTRHSEILEEVFRRSGLKSVAQLVECWHEWHVEHLQPISDFSLTPIVRSFGIRLYQEEMEKRLCAELIAKELVHDADHVILPEGTSTFWVGLGVLQQWENLWIITSNGALVRELHENAALRQHAKAITVIGGEIDLDVDAGGAASRGFIGHSTRVGFDAAIIDKPGATVVVSSVNGLLPDTGPYAPCPTSGFTRHSLLLKALDSNVRKVVFVADYTKVSPRRIGDYGDAIFSDPKQWREILEKHRSRIVIVVAPPPEVRNNPDLMAVRPADRVIRGKGYSPPIVEYLTVAAEFDRLCQGTTFASSFKEVGAPISGTGGPVK